MPEPNYLLLTCPLWPFLIRQIHQQPSLSLGNRLALDLALKGIEFLSRI